MKTTLYSLTFLTFVLLAFMPNSFAQDVSLDYVVRVIYFIPNDREPDLEMNTKLDTLIKEAQKYYADQMEAHGFERKTFRLETDANDNVIVHRVNGLYDEAYYQNPSTGSFIVWDEIEGRFDVSKNIYFIVLDTNVWYLDGQDSTIGLASGNSHNGRTLIPSPNVNIYRYFAAFHELGHAFGLSHDTRPNAKLIHTHSRSQDPMAASFCAAEWLDVNRYFNPVQETINRDPTIRMLPPTLASPPATIRLQFEITDSDELHQAQLYLPKDDTLLDYKSLSGSSATIEFLTKDLIDLPPESSIVLRVLDARGNFTERDFTIDPTHLILQGDEVSIPDANLERVIREELGLTPSDTITQQDMLRLTELRANEQQITNLNGLEHAKRLRRLDLSINQIRDIIPLSGLTNLQELHIYLNSFSDVSQLSGLTNLQELYIGSNPIRDISSLSGLTNLNQVNLNSTEISDVSPLSGLTNLIFLNLYRSPVSDLSPLSGLTNLQTLYLAGNTIRDVSPLAQLTELEVLGLSYTSISDFSFLADFTHLDALFLDGNGISDISFLAGLTNLYQLDLNNNSIRDLSPLAGLTDLLFLHLSGNEISDVSVLKGLTNLWELFLVSNPIKNRKPLLELLRKNPDIKIYLKDWETPLPVTLSHFRAELTEAGVLLKWITESEVDNAGFYIYRSETKDGDFAVVNAKMIRGAGTTGERTEYSWTDTTAKPNTVYYYRIEDVSHAGVREQLATVRLRGLVSATGKLITTWSDLKRTSTF